MSLRSAKYANKQSETHVKESNRDHEWNHGNQKKHDKNHAEEASKGQGKEAHPPMGAAPVRKVPPVQAPGSQGSCQDGPRRAELRSVDRELMIMPEWLIRHYNQHTQEGRIDATDQGHQYCHVTAQEVREAYYSSTPLRWATSSGSRRRSGRRNTRPPPNDLAKDDGGTDADERSRGGVINLQYEDRSIPIPYPGVRSALRDLNSGTTRQERIRRLVTHWSGRDLTHLPPEQREAQEL